MVLLVVTTVGPLERRTGIGIASCKPHTHAPPTREMRAHAHTARGRGAWYFYKANGDGYLTLSMSILILILILIRSSKLL